MAFVMADRVKEPSNSIGTDTVTLTGTAYTGYRTFTSAVTTGSVVCYCIHNTATGFDGEWEVGYGTFTTSGNTLSRTSVYASSNAGALVNFSAGAKEVFITDSASLAASKDPATGVISNSITTATSANTASAIVSRDASGDFSAGTITATLSGNASNVSGTVAVANGGTGSTTAADARTALSAQETLVSATNIKTINGNTLLGAGDLVVSGGGSSTITIDDKTAAYTVVAGDIGKVINCTSGTFTVSLTAAATLGSGFNCWIWNTSNTQTDAITIDPANAETIDGITTLILRRSEGMQIVCDGVNWQTGDKKVMRGYAENWHNTTTRPIATGNSAIAIGSNATSSGTNCLAVGTSASSSGNYSFAAYGTASGNFSTAIANGATASSVSSTAIGQNSGGTGSQAVTGSGAMALGGSYASGTDSFAAAVANNTSSYGATGVTSVAIGNLAKANNYYSTAIGFGATASNVSALALGRNAVASGEASVAIGNYTNLYPATANKLRAVAIGEGALADVVGKFAFGGGDFIATSTWVQGLQSGLFILKKQTTDATATPLTTDSADAAATNQITLRNNSAYHFRIQVIGMQQAAGGTNAAGYTFTGVIRRGANAAATSLLGSSKSVDYESDTSWDCNISADTTNGGLAVTVTGAAATNIRWVATCWTSEVTYA